MKTEDTETKKKSAGIAPLQRFVSNLFFTMPLPANGLYHVFKTGEMRSLCCKYGMLRIDPEQTTQVKGTESYRKGEDCKACFKKAGLQV